MKTQMKVNNSIKRYWARTGPKSVFGSDWVDREDLSDADAEQRFDQVWASDLYPAIQSGRRVSTADAQAKVPNDGRQKYFDARQEHREFQLCGTTLLAQIDLRDNRLTQMWHLKDKGEGRVYSPTSTVSSAHTPKPAHANASVTSTPSARKGDALAQLASRTGLPKVELAALIATALAEILMRVESGSEGSGSI
jgi:hypothetical protein